MKGVGLMKISILQWAGILMVFLFFSFFLKINSDKIDNYEINLMEGGVLMNVDSQKAG